MDFVSSTLKFDNNFVVEAKGCAGGLCMMWKKGISAIQVEFNKNLIAIKISDAICEWLLVGFYGPPYFSKKKKKKAWENLSALLDSYEGPWVCLGDFNFTINEDERKGSKKGSTSATNYLKELMFEQGAIDLGYSGNKYTWAKGKWGNASIKRRLDRGIVSISWRLAFPKANIFHLGAIKSDHAPILLDTYPEEEFTHRPFRFEAIWLRDNRCIPVIENAWTTETRGSEFIKLYKKQASTRDALRKWNKEVFGRCQDKINSLLQEIKVVQCLQPSEENGNLESALQNELAEWLFRSETLWRQKSREIWLKLGDKNSKFFHLSTIIRRRRNHIDAIKKDDGSWITESKQIRQLFFESYKQQYQEEEIWFPNHLEHLLLPCITEDENANLLATPSPEEIKATLFEMQDLKAPGSDGFPVLFYKKLWPTIGKDVTEAVTSFFRLGSMPREVNSSLIVLIPKISNPSNVNHFRPISLCNVVYKIISKLLIAKFRPLLDKIISLAQSAFIPNRWIAENQVIIQELLHGFKTRKLKPGLMAIKLDLQKAYDRVNWKFIQSILLHLGFNDTFTNWIIACVSSVTFEIMVNGGKTEKFKPSRGLRQGDPLSSYLFILGQEVLSRLLEKELMNKNFSGIKASQRGPTITHVMYADDIVLFSKAGIKDAHCLVRVLNKYCRWSGQRINFNKSGVFFSRHTQLQHRRSIKSILNIKNLKKDAVYLGAPLLLSRAPTKDFAFLQDRLEAKLMGWRSKCLSWAGRKTLITSVAQSLPTYTMSTFNVPNKVCDKLDSFTRRFWWKPKEQEGRFIAWRAWDKLCIPKSAGGLGSKKPKT
ncbi:hypothetical protein SO802_025847 [Lithocarpus litseifolius]|uniref:Reverse transcriptase domain-containing protein n=1 Tax=Lithocarpus litseifolius TaxID=425828 RepID=A0AAW2BZV5_9ROSI